MSNGYICVYVLNLKDHGLYKPLYLILQKRNLQKRYPLKWNWCKEIVKFQYIIESHGNFRERTKLLLMIFKIALILFINKGFSIYMMRIVTESLVSLTHPFDPTLYNPSRTKFLWSCSAVPYKVGLVVLALMSIIVNPGKVYHSLFSLNYR